jgi:hypothetical protein
LRGRGSYPKVFLIDCYASDSQWCRLPRALVGTSLLSCSHAHNARRQRRQVHQRSRRDLRPRVEDANSRRGFTEPRIRFSIGPATQVLRRSNRMYSAPAHPPSPHTRVPKTSARIRQPPPRRWEADLLRRSTCTGWAWTCRALRVERVARQRRRGRQGIRLPPAARALARTQYPSSGTLHVAGLVLSVRTRGERSMIASQTP